MYNAAPFHAMSGVELTGFSPTRHRLGDTFSSHNQSPMRDAWSHAGQPGLNLGAEIKSELFQTKHDDASSMYANPASSVQNPSLEPSLFQEFNNLTSMFPPAQVVIPSQVNPQEDYHMEQFNDYDTNERVVEEFSRSFDSSTTGYSGWETVGPQSPDAAYYVPSEDEDYLMVKDEFEGSPGSFQYRSPQRVNRRATRKSRKTLGPSHVLAEHDRHGILVSYEGTPWKYDSAGNAIAKHTDGAKPHLRCNWVEKDGSKCSAKFVRSEHLKRHMTKHSKEKPYPCPLNGCEKAIKRPDNAGDHFRTHLKPAAKGKRNKECTLEQLAAAMHADPLWDEKKTTKMLNNLFKWFHEFTQQGEEKKRLQTFDEEAKAQAKRMQQSRHMHFKL
ncbi:uncharacterized protein RCC_04760 [Ramularia collo-cygni]|uniref:C2H2-type domain-containing protein n=1 Tax=Ramularia collo-cygni TaxID=112498 RepID=A0A2D3UX67_9PEZI|nr:uncharacterized protein RCC_04760 [Ramularia collo-cygni]CZT18915.1 uncharacterized protein RCC_04760 [Ramularia collo-cygni]